MELGYEMVGCTHPGYADFEALESARMISIFRASYLENEATVDQTRTADLMKVDAAKAAQKTPLHSTKTHDTNAWRSFRKAYQYRALHSLIARLKIYSHWCWYNGEMMCAFFQTIYSANR